VFAAQRGGLPESSEPVHISAQEAGEENSSCPPGLNFASSHGRINHVDVGAAPRRPTIGTPKRGGPLQESGQ